MLVKEAVSAAGTRPVTSLSSTFDVSGSSRPPINAITDIAMR